MIWKYLLRIWGWVCLLAAALHGALTLYAAAVPYNIYQPGSTGLAEWLGMGLISHGLAHVMARLCCPNFSLCRNGITTGQRIALTANAMMIARMVSLIIILS